jgi:hypothetical protein
MKGPDDRITIRFDRALGKKIRALAKRRGLSVAEYCRLMCSLEVLIEEPDQPATLVQQQMKETLTEMEHFGHLDPQHQAALLRRSLEVFTAARNAVNEGLTWLTALIRASDAFTRHRSGRTREPLDS